MSTVNDPLKYLWRAEYQDGHTITQPENDQHPDHNPEAEHNPSAFRLVEDYLSKSPLLRFSIFSPANGIVMAEVDLTTGKFGVYSSVGEFHIGSLERPHVPKLIYYRIVQQDRVITPIIEDGKIVGQTTEDKAPEIKGYALGWVDRGKTNEHVLVLE